MVEHDEWTSPESDRKGVDGLNLVEFPLSVLSRRIPPGQKTLEFCERRRERGQLVERRLTISGSDKFGLPTYKHHDLLVGLIQLTWEKNGASSPRIDFSRYELLKMLGWADTGPNYKLVEHALNVWMGTTLYYKDSWWVDGSWKSKTFNVLEDAEIYGTRKGGPKKRTKEQLQEEPSYVVWGSVPFAEFQERRTKGLDYEFYRSLKYAVSRQLYRYLDKWFHYGPTYRYPDLRMFACEKVGISRAHDNSNLMREIDRGVEELAGRGYLKNTDRGRRYRKSGNVYEVIFERAGRKKHSGKTLPIDGIQKELIRELRKRGVRNDMPLALVASTSPKAVREAIENFDDRRAHGEDIGPGFLVAALKSQEGFSFRKGFRPAAAIEARQNAILERDAAEKEYRTLQATLEKLQEAVPLDAFAKLSERYRTMLEEEALKKADPFLLKSLERAQKGGEDEKARMLQNLVIEKHFKQVKEAVKNEEDTRGAAVDWVESAASCFTSIRDSEVWHAVQKSAVRFRDAEQVLSSIRKVENG